MMKTLLFFLNFLPLGPLGNYLLLEWYPQSDSFLAIMDYCRSLVVVWLGECILIFGVLEVYYCDLVAGGVLLSNFFL